MWGERLVYWHLWETWQRETRGQRSNHNNEEKRNQVKINSRSKKDIILIIHQNNIFLFHVFFFLVSNETTPFCPKCVISFSFFSIMFFQNNIVLGKWHIFFVFKKVLQVYRFFHFSLGFFNSFIFSQFELFFNISF